MNGADRGSGFPCLVLCLRSSWHLFCTTWFAASSPKSRSFGSAEVGFAQDDRSFFDMDIGDRTLALERKGTGRARNIRNCTLDPLSGVNAVQGLKTE
jgi:hypothetical protein